MFKITKLLTKNKLAATFSVSSLHRIRCISGYEIVNNATLFYEKHGMNPDKTVLCVPGALGTTQSDFSYQLKEISKDFTMVSFDPRGFGKSKKVARNFNENFYEADANDGIQLMKKLGYDKYSVMGWSDGGIAGLVMAIKAPESVENLVVWGSNSYISEVDKKIVAGIRDLSKWSERMRKPLEDEYGKEGLEKLWHGWIDGYSKLNDICSQSLDKIKCPTYILHGQKDPMLEGCHPHYLHEKIADSKLHVMPEGKHNIHMRYHEEFNTLVTKFLLGVEVGVQENEK